MGAGALKRQSKGFLLSIPRIIDEITVGDHYKDPVLHPVM
jgi:hypothetical protein